jgi:hypothetical protein
MAPGNGPLISKGSLLSYGITSRVEERLDLIESKSLSDSGSYQTVTTRINKTTGAITQLGSSVFSTNEAQTLTRFGTKNPKWRSLVENKMNATAPYSRVERKSTRSPGKIDFRWIDTATFDRRQVGEGLIFLTDPSIVSGYGCP